MIYIHNYLYSFLASDIRLGKRESHKAISKFPNSNNFSFPQLHILTLKSTNIASKAVNQRKSPQLKIPNNR